MQFVIVSQQQMEISVINEFKSLFLGSPKHQSLVESQLECVGKNPTKELPSSNSKQQEVHQNASNQLFPLGAVNANTAPRPILEQTHHVHVLQYPVITESNRRLGERGTGLSKKYCRLLKKLKVSKTSQSCSICQHSFQKQQLIVQLPCKHIFHKKGCLDEWLKVSVHCPICKSNLEEYFKNQEPIEPRLQ